MEPDEKIDPDEEIDYKVAYGLVCEQYEEIFNTVSRLERLLLVAQQEAQDAQQEARTAREEGYRLYRRIQDGLILPLWHWAQETKQQDPGFWEILKRFRRKE